MEFNSKKINAFPKQSLQNELGCLKLFVEGVLGTSRGLQGSESVPKRGGCVHGAYVHACVGEGSYIYLCVGVSYLTNQLIGLLFV